MKTIPSRTPRQKRRIMPPDIPETAPAPAAKGAPEEEPLPEDIRKMLEAAYT